MAADDPGRKGPMDLMVFKTGFQLPVCLLINRAGAAGGAEGRDDNSSLKKVNTRILFL
jgi:hypothetical protein